MVLVAAAIFAEKVLPRGDRIARFLSPGLLALAVVVVLAPSIRMGP